MATVGEISESIRSVGQRLIQQTSAFGWSASTPISQHIGIGGFIASAEDISRYFDIVSLKVERLNKQQLETDGFGKWLGQIHGRLDQASFNQMNQGNSFQVSSAVALIQMIESAIPPLPPREPKLNWEDLKVEKNLIPRDLASRLRHVESRLKDLEPRSKEVGAKIADIENAHATAEQLPTDLEDLKERRAELIELIESARVLGEQIAADSRAVLEEKIEFERYISTKKNDISECLSSASALLKQSEHALRGATEVGLSKSFDARKKSLSEAGLYWTVGLAISLTVAVMIGAERVGALKEVLSGDKSAVVIIVNFLLALMGVAAPVWFAWLATKQIGTNFRLAEDYAFKSLIRNYPS